jgi:hypothetical protein
MAYNFAKLLKSIRGKSPWQFILNQWTIHPEYFIFNPNHFLLGLNTSEVFLNSVLPHTPLPFERSWEDKTLEQWQENRQKQNSSWMK